MAVMAGLVPAIHVLLAPRVHIKQKPIMRVLVLAARMRPSCARRFAREGRAECRVPTHPQPRMQSKKAYELVTTGKAGVPGIPHATVLTVSSALSPVIGLVCHRRFASAQNLTPASRRQDHTTSPSAFSTVRQRRHPRPSHPVPRSMTIASAPWWDETARLGRCFASNTNAFIFVVGAGQLFCPSRHRALWRGRPFAQQRHCERSEAIQLGATKLDCFVASLLAKTDAR